MKPSEGLSGHLLVISPYVMELGICGKFEVTIVGIWGKSVKQVESQYSVSRFGKIYSILAERQKLLDELQRLVLQNSF